MKHSLHIRPAEFEFIGFEYDNPEELTTEAIERGISDYRRSREMLKVGIGLETKVWNKVLDKYLAGEGMSIGEGELMDEQQKWMIHELDKSFNRQTRNNHEN